MIDKLFLENITRRAFLLFSSSFLLSCSSKTVMESHESRQKLPDDYSFGIEKLEEGNKFKIKVVKIKSERVIKTQNEYEVNNDTDGTHILRNSKNSRDTIRGIIVLSLELALSPLNILFNTPITRERKGKQIKEVSREEKIVEQILPDSDRGMAIIIKPIGKHIIVKTNRFGEAIFYFGKAVLETEMYPKNYELSFYHDKIPTPVYSSVQGNVFASALFEKRKNTKNTKNDQNETIVAKKRIKWFSKAEKAASIASNYPTAKSLARLYRKYGKTARFVTKAMRVLSLHTIIGFVVIEAFFIFVEYTLKKYGYEVD